MKIWDKINLEHPKLIYESPETYLSGEMVQVYLWASRDLMLVTLIPLVSKLPGFLSFSVNKDPMFSLSTVSFKSVENLPSDQNFETSL